MVAAYIGDFEIVELLIQEGADVNAVTKSGGYTALILAADNANTEMVKLLIDAEADVNAKDNNGRTALLAATWAVYQGHTEIMELLREAGALK